MWSLCSRHGEWCSGDEKWLAAGIFHRSEEYCQVQYLTSSGCQNVVSQVVGDDRFHAARVIAGLCFNFIAARLLLRAQVQIMWQARECAAFSAGARRA